MKRRIFSAVVLAAGLLSTGEIAVAGQADVVAAKAIPSAKQWRFEVTVRHADTGWDHYADRWEILAPDGTVLGVRELLHPHVEEQPFTRSLGGISIGPSIEEVVVRARDSVHGYGGEEIRLSLPR